MKTMTHRTTFALDTMTANRLKALSARWQVSQAEVVRRSVLKAEQESPADPLALLHALHETGRVMEPDTAKDYLSHLREERKRWGSR